MLGVILCGGKSTRMGTDKGLLAPPPPKGEIEQVSLTTWVETAAEKIIALQIPFVISVNKEQYETYSSLFPAEQLIKDNETLQLHGPLCGVLSVHLKKPAEDMFILACDMPLMETEPLKELLKHYRQYPERDAFVYTNNTEPEPLCGIYKSTALESVHQLYLSGQLVKHSMKFMLDHINPHFIPLTDDQKKYFRNFNAHAELNGL
jgi:molybdenum cofactor guanylyltransferase